MLATDALLDCGGRLAELSAQTQAKLADAEKLRAELAQTQAKLGDAEKVRGDLDEARAKAKEGDDWKAQAENGNVQLSKLREQLTALSVDRDGIKSGAEAIPEFISQI